MVIQMIARRCSIVLLFSLSQQLETLHGEGIPIAEIQRESKVDFETEILPLLRKNCLACHNQTDAEGELVLETSSGILRGGSTGAAVIPGNGTESLLLRVSAHAADPKMPPEDNRAGAMPMTSQELGLLRLWIDQGALGEARRKQPVQWQSLPAGINPIYAVAVTRDGQIAAAGRANQIYLYHLASKQEFGRLTDARLDQPGKPSIAHRDLIQSLRFSPDGQYLASGGFGNVKLWRRSPPSQVTSAEFGKLTSTTISSDGAVLAFASVSGIDVYELPSLKLRKEVQVPTENLRSIVFSKDTTKLVYAEDKFVRMVDVATGAIEASIETADSVTSVACGLDGGKIVVANADFRVRVYGFDGVLQKELAGHTGAITAISTVASAPGEIVTGSADGTLRRWDLQQAKQLQQIDHGNPVSGLAVRGDGQRLASIGGHGGTKLWDASGKLIGELHGDFSSQFEVGHANRRALVAKQELESTKGELKVANERKASEEKNAKTVEEGLKKADADLLGKTEAVKKLADEYAATEKLVVSAKAMLEMITQDKQETEARLAMLQDSMKVAQAGVATADVEVERMTAAAKVVRDHLEEGLTKARQRAEAHPENAALTAMVRAIDEGLKGAADGLIAKARDHQVAMTERTKLLAADQSKLSESKQRLEEMLAKAQGEIKVAEEKLKQSTEALKKGTEAETAASKVVEFATNAAERARQALQDAVEAIPLAESVVKAAEGQIKNCEQVLAERQSFAMQTAQPHRAVAFSLDGKRVITVDEGQVLRTWDSESGLPIEAYRAHSSPTQFVGGIAGDEILSLSPDGRAIVWGANPSWALEREIGSEEGESGLADRVTAIDFSPDGTVLATGSGEPSRWGQLKFWKVVDGSFVGEVKDPHSDTIYGMEFSPEGSLIATSAADRTAKIFDVATGKHLRTFEGHTHHVLGVSWRMDGRVLATGGADHLVKVWNVRTGEQIRTITGYNKEVTAIKFVAERSQIVTCSADSLVQLKNAENGSLIQGMPGTAEFIYSLAISADGKRVVAGGQDSILRVWNEAGQPFATFMPP